MKKILLMISCISAFVATNAQNVYEPNVTVSTLAGSGVRGSTDGTGTVASFYQPFGVAVDASGNVYVADYGSNKIRKITPLGVVSTLAGNNKSGSTDGVGTAASFYYPNGVAVDASGNVYVADVGNYKIRKITPAGVVSSLAGGTFGNADGIGTVASFSSPVGLTVDASNNLYVADQGNNKIRKITPSGVVSSLAGSTYSVYGSTDGTGTAASFNSPKGVAVDASGNVYVADYVNNMIRKITPAGVVSTLAGSTKSGSSDGVGTAASFYYPAGVAVDTSGNVYVADMLNNMIRKITPAGVVSTLAGSTTSGSKDGVGTAASFFQPRGVAVDASGNVYVADLGNDNIRKISIGTKVGIENDLLSSQVEVYPNPAQNNLYIKTVLNIASYEIQNLTGEVLKSSTLENNTINIAYLSQGLYFLKLQTDKGIDIVKFVKE